MRRASAELESRRRASLGATRGLRPDGTLDPHHAAILFRDSRGVSFDGDEPISLYNCQVWRKDDKGLGCQLLLL